MLLSSDYSHIVSTSQKTHMPRLVSMLFLIFACSISAKASASDAGSQPYLSGTAQNVKRIVYGIVSYTRWPALTTRPRMCFSRSTPYLDALTSPNNAESMPYQPVILTEINSTTAAQCDGIYFGQESAQTQQTVIQQLPAGARLFISENNPQCVTGSAFCLAITSDSVKFSVNLDSLTRSGVHVSPDVLLLARKTEK
ncbi:YfiR family protein [Mangrovibacter phragmitis]|nr:YfiR family protein [Mangrovibacter phragmitis]